MANINDVLLRIGNIIALIVTIIIKGLTGTTLLNGRTTAEVSAAYPTLVSSAGFVFNIWSLIYFLLLVLAIYQMLPSEKDKTYQKQIGALFILSTVFNCVWLFLWQYDFMTLSAIVMLALLATVIAIYWRLGIGKTKAPFREKLFVHLPFSVYLGWIAIVTIVNIAIALVSEGWDGFGVSPQIWAIIVLLIVLIIALVVIVTRRDIAYSLVTVWGLAGIAIRQSLYPNIVLTAEVAIVAILAALAVTVAAWRLRHNRA